MTPLRWVALTLCLGAVEPPVAVLIDSPAPAWAGKALEASLNLVAFVVVTWATIEIVEWIRARQLGRNPRGDR
jgi:hypothetical protein